MRKLLTERAIVKLILATVGAIQTFAIVETVVKMNKTAKITGENEDGTSETFTFDNPFHGQILKTSKIEGRMNWSFSHNVNMEMQKARLEPNFVSQPRTWGVRMGETSVVTHKDNTYLEIKVIKSLWTEYKTLDGNAIDKAEFEEFLPPRRVSNHPKENVICRDYKLSNIKELKLNGRTVLVA